MTVSERDIRGLRRQPRSAWSGAALRRETIEALQTAFRLLTRARAEHLAGHRADPRGGSGLRRGGRAARVHPLLRARRHQSDAVRPHRRQRTLPPAGARNARANWATRWWPSPSRRRPRPRSSSLAARCYWISLGELSQLIEICKSEGITEVMMAGQVKHAKIFSSIRPDWRLVKLLASLPREEHRRADRRRARRSWRTRASTWPIRRRC